MASCCAGRRSVCVRAGTTISGLRVPQAIGDFLILDAVRESGGFAIAVDDDAIQSAQVEIARDEGLMLCPEGAATYAAYREARSDGRIQAGVQIIAHLLPRPTLGDFAAFLCREQGRGPTLWL